jgi:hypothetical protein
MKGAGRSHFHMKGSASGCHLKQDALAIRLYFVVSIESHKSQAGR